MSGYVLDTSALLTVLNNEPGVEAVLDVLEAAGSGEVRVYLPFMALMELEYLSLRQRSREATRGILTLVEAWPVEIEESTQEWRHEAARVKAIASISLADAWICGLACLMDAELVHKDPEYDGVPGLRALQLPYKA
jgi:predicted nucleic acid-binding protein